MRSTPYAVRTPFLFAIAATALVVIVWATFGLAGSLSAVTW